MRKKANFALKDSKYLSPAKKIVDKWYAFPAWKLWWIIWSPILD